MRARVPTARVRNEYEAFPAGYYDGTIAGAEVRDGESGDNQWKSLRLSLSDVTPREGTEDPGRSRYTGDIAVQSDGVDVREVDDFGNDDLPWRIQQAGELLGGIAEGLGVFETEGKFTVFDPEAVLAALESGDLEGERLGFSVRNFEVGEGDDAETRDAFGQFGPAS